MTRVPRYQLFLCLFLASCLFFISTAKHAQNVRLASVNQAHAISLSGLSSYDILSLVVQHGYARKGSVNELLATLTFDRVFSFLTKDELLQAMIDHNLVTGSSGVSGIKSAMQSRDIDHNILRNDGIITAMATAKNGSLLMQKPGRNEWNIARDAKDTLRSSFENDRAGFLDLLTPQRLLELFEDRITATSGSSRTFYASSSQNLPSSQTNITYVAKLEDDTTPDALKTLTNAQPAGRRIVHVKTYYVCCDYYKGLYPPLRDENGQAVRKANGEPLYTIWLDEWEQTEKAQNESFWAAYKAAGGQIDTAILDIEVDWAAIYDARFIWIEGKEQYILNDPRWPALFARLNETGITDLQNFSLWVGQHDYREVKWDAVLERMQAEAINRAVYEPLRRHFPSVRFTNYEGFHRNQTVPWGNYRKYPHSEYSIGNIIGTHQSIPLYGGGGPTATKDGNIDEASSNPTTSYDWLVGNVKGMRTMVSTSTVPVMPWIAHPYYGEVRSGKDVFDHYAESVFHLSLNNPEALLLWTWSQLKVLIGAAEVDAGTAVLDRALKELDSLAGYANARTVSFENVDYQNGYVLTGLEAGGKRIWRLTPDPRVSFSVTSNAPATFSIGGKTVTIPGSRIITAPNTVSTLGYWIEQTDPSMLIQPASTVLQALQSSSSTPPPSGSSSSSTGGQQQAANTSSAASKTSKAASSVQASSENNQLATDYFRTDLNEVERLRLERSERLKQYLLNPDQNEQPLLSAAPNAGVMQAVLPAEPFSQLAATDVPSDSPYKDAVAHLYDKGIIKGQNNESGRFDLGSTTNRAEVVTMIGRLLGLEIPNFPFDPFNDMRKTDWYSSAVFASIKAGFVKGYPDGTFRGNDPVTVVEMVKLAAILADLASQTDEGSGINWYDVYVNAAQQSTLLHGMDLPPLDQHATRGWVIQILSNADAILH